MGAQRKEAVPVAQVSVRRRRSKPTTPEGQATAGTSGRLKIALVSPYGYPHPGGVNDHVRNQYEELRRLGHDAWIITSKYGKERESEGHIIRLGTGWAFPTNGSMGRVTLGWRFKEQARELLA